MKRMRGSLALGATVIVILALGLVGVSSTGKVTSTAEKMRQTDEVARAHSFAGQVGSSFDNVTPQVNGALAGIAVSFAADTAANKRAVARLNTFFGFAGIQAALVDLSGRVVSVDPKHPAVPADTEVPALVAQMRTGKAGVSSVVGSGATAAVDIYVPVLVGKTVGGGVLLSLSLSKELGIHDSLVGYANVKPGHGGYSITDAKGIVAAAWDSTMVGKPIVSPVTPASSASQSVRTITLAGKKTVQISAPMPHGMMMYFTQPAGEFYGGIEHARLVGLLALVALLVVAAASLVYLNHRRNRVLHVSERRLAALIANADDVIMVIGNDTVSYAGPGTAKMFGLEPAELLGRPYDSVIGADARALIEPIMQRATAKPGEAVSGDLQIEHTDGEKRWLEISVCDPGRGTGVDGLVLTHKDITERRALQDELHYEATHDRLTGLPNRAMFEQRIEEAFARARRSGLGVSVLYIDLDGFKQVNDTLGHGAGDELLRTVAARIYTSLRETDMVARLGGDEFAVVVEQVADQREVEHVVARLQATIGEPVPLGEDVATVGASVGIAHGSGEDAAAAVVRDADIAMYEAKALRKSGRGIAIPAPAAAVDDVVSAPAPES